MAQRRSGSTRGSGAPHWTQPQPQSQPAPGRLWWLRVLWPLLVVPVTVFAGFVLYAELKYRPAPQADPPGATALRSAAPAPRARARATPRPAGRRQTRAERRARAKEQQRAA